MARFLLGVEGVVGLGVVGGVKLPLLESDIGVNGEEVMAVDICRVEVVDIDFLREGEGALTSTNANTLNKYQNYILDYVDAYLEFFSTCKV